MGRKEKGSTQQRNVSVKIQLGTGVATVIAGSQVAQVHVREGTRVVWGKGCVNLRENESLFHGASATH